MKQHYRIGLLLLFAIAFSFHDGAAQKILIHYWNFNSTLPLGGAGGVHLGAIPADYSTIGNAAVVDQRLPGVVADTNGYMDNLAPDTTCHNLNARNGDSIGSAIRTRNPSDSMEFLWFIPTTNYKNILLTYETQSSSVTHGQLHQLYSYSIDSGATYITTGLTPASDSAGLAWGLVTVDLSAITAVNNTNKFVFRITYSGNAAATSGNNRYDNITVEGDTNTTTSTGGGGGNTTPTISLSSHTANAWSTNPIVNMKWSAVTGTTAPLQGYSFLWDHAATTIPDSIVETTDSSAITDIGQGTNWYFHVRAVDNTGKPYGTTHFGPVNIDTAAPHAPTLVSTSTAFTQWSAAMIDTMRWNILAADTAGLHDLLGYAWSWTQSPATIQDSVNKGIAASAVSSALTNGNWYLHVRCVDSANNWSDVAHFGPLRIDHTAPTISTIAINNGATKTTLDTITIAITAIDSGSGSGVAQMQASNDGTTWSALMPFAKSWSGWNLKSYGGTSAAGEKHIYVRVLDSAGNISGSIKDSIQYAPSAVRDAVMNPSSLQMQVYPNPASSAMRVQFAENISSIASLRVFDVIGREMLREEIAQGANGVSLDVQGLRAGVYVMRLQNIGGEMLSTEMIRIVK